MRFLWVLKVSKSLKQKFSGTNQKPERPQQFGTGLVRHYPQGLFSLFFSFLRAIFFRLFRLSLAPTICPWVSEDDAHLLWWYMPFADYTIRIGIRTQLVVISFSDGVIKVWDYSTGEAGKLLRSVREHDGWVTSFLFWLVNTPADHLSPTCLFFSCTLIFF